MEIFETVTECKLVPESGNTRITFNTESGPHTIELTQSAVADLIPGLVAQPPVTGQPSTVANAITPVGCLPFESLQGLCGLAFNLGDRNLHIAVPPNGLASVRQALDVVELAYRNQRMPRMPQG